jgi:hypothetical protein
MSNTLAMLTNLKTKPQSKTPQQSGVKVNISNPTTNVATTTNVVAATNVPTTTTNVVAAKEKAQVLEGEKGPYIKITNKDDNGSKAEAFMKKMQEQRKSMVKAPASKEVVEEPVTKAPVIEEVPKVTKIRKLKQKPLLLLEEDVAIVPEKLPEGGPMLQEEGDQEGEKEKEVDPAFADAFKRAEEGYAKKQSDFLSGVEIITNLKGKKNTYYKMTPDIQVMHLGDTSIRKRLPVTPPFRLQVSELYMNNRELFVQSINDMFKPYSDDLQDESKDISCDTIGKDTGNLGLLTHQKIVREYMNLYTPYRGLLLYHGLGSGKTCSSIAIAEGLKSYRRIIIMTPASLSRNYMEEIKKCGDLIYRKNQFWEWISTDPNPDLIPPLSAALGLPIEYIKKNRGAWLVNVRKPTNYNDLSTSDKKGLNAQIDEMIKYKYTFINYNGLRHTTFMGYTNNLETNLFDNAVVIIDEAHNLISRIVNNINKFNKFEEQKRGPGELLQTKMSLQIYEFLLRAENCRIVLLTGTPIINYPNEIGILFNILRGYIKTWSFNINVSGKTVTKESILALFSKERVLDYIDYSNGLLTVTRNPFGFQNKITSNSGYKGVRYDKHDVDKNGKFITHSEEGVISDDAFIKRVISVLRSNNYEVVPNTTTFKVHTALPDTMDAFIHNFIDKDSGEVYNTEKFKRRVIGLTSYFRSAQEELLPRYNRATDRHIVKIPMSDYQFQIYEEARASERKLEKPGKKGTAKVDSDGLFVQPVSTYKIFSRLFCNFVMPNPPGRPTPNLLNANKTDRQVDEYMRDRNTEIIRDVKKYTRQYLDSFSDEYKDDPKNMEQIKKNINLYNYICLKEKLDIKDFDEFLSEDYQTFLENSKYGYLTKYRALPASEKVKYNYNYEFVYGEEPKEIEEEKQRREKRYEKESQIRKDTREKKEAKEKGKPDKIKEKEEKISKGEAKLRANLEKEAERIMKADEKQRKANEKQRLLDEKEAEKKRKEEEKKRKEEEKEEEKKRKEEEKKRKEEEKQKKEEEKKRKGKGNLFDDHDYFSDSDSNTESSSSSDYSESESESESESDSDSDSDSESSSSSDYSESDYSDSESSSSSDTDYELMKGGAKGKDLLREWVDKDENDDDFSVVSLPGVQDEDALFREKHELEGDEVLEMVGKNAYRTAITDVVNFLSVNKERYLDMESLKMYSPKFYVMIENIQRREHVGLHLVYSQFRSMEGIGIFALALESNGYARFKIVRDGTDAWKLDMSESDLGKPTYALYTGTESAEEREIIRNIYNGDWNNIPNNISTLLRARSTNNNMGEIIKVLMITSAGSEGINLRNTRYVHIMEPYWHPVRLEQVVGRARRICSHQGLEEQYRTVEVFVYLMVFTKEQLDTDSAIELKLKDCSKIPPYAPQSSDENLFEILTRKENLTTQLLASIKESSIDCATHIKSNSKEGIQCLSFNQPTINSYAFRPEISEEQIDTIAKINTRKVEWEAVPIKYRMEENGKQKMKLFMLRVDNNDVYDHESVANPLLQPRLLGKFIDKGKNSYIEFF